MKVTKWTGGKITQPGIYSGLSLEKYHSADICDGPSASSGMLRKIIGASPAHMYATWAGNPKRVEEPPSKYMVLGQAAHHLLLSQDAFATQFAVRPREFSDWRTKASQEWRELAEKEGRTVLIPDQLEQIRGMAKALAAHPVIQAGCLNGEVECSMFWKDQETGIWLKSRPDASPNDSGDYCDLKCTNSVLDMDLKRTIDSSGYHQQGALVCEGAYRLLALPTTSFTLVFVEYDPPYCVRIVSLPEQDLQRGERMNRHAIRVFAKCIETGEWPGPGKADAEVFGLSENSTKWIDKRLEEWGV